jgi:hypothetical protein
VIAWPTPSPGDIVWCHFPFLPASLPGPKPRPGLVLGVRVLEEGVVVTIAYGTSQRVRSLRSGEFLISKDLHPAAYKLAGLSYDTKFDLGRLAELPWSERYFKVPPNPSSMYGQCPKMGSLHASLMKALLAAHAATRK